MTKKGSYGSTEKVELYCHHIHSCDCVTFYNADGQVADMSFCDWSSNNNDKWDAMQRLWYPFKDTWNGELKDGVEYYYGAPWENKKEEKL